jgi:hypothetical protein
MDTIPADDLQRNLAVAKSDDPKQPHIGLVGNTLYDSSNGKRHGWPLLPDRHSCPARRRSGSSPT